MNNSRLNKLFKLIFHFSLVLIAFLLTQQETNAQIFDGTYTGTVSGSILQSEYNDNLYGGKIRNTTTFKQIIFKVSTKSGFEIEGEIIGEWKSVSTVRGETEKKDWKQQVICRNYAKSGGLLPSDKSLSFSCGTSAYVNVITLEGTISNGVINGKWQTREGASASGTFQAATSSHSTSVLKPENKIESHARFSSVNGQVEIWHENETENDSKIAKIDTVLYEGDHIKTDEDATCILVFGDMSNFVMKSESEIILAKTEGPESKLKLVLGNIWVNVKHMIKDGSMEVDMSQAVAGIKGTKFEVWEDSSRKESTLRVEEGTVEFRHKVTGKTMLIAAGQTVKATPKGFISVEAINVDKATKKTLDSVVTFDNGKAYIFSGNQYIRFDIALDRADSGYPKPLSQWSLPWIDRIDEAVNWGNGKVYIFKGNQYIRFDINADRVDEGYPKPINNETWNGLQFFFE